MGAFFCLLWACDMRDQASAREAYAVQCGACHLPPEIENLPKDLWSDEVLPDMAARAGISTVGYDPLSGMSFEEQKAVMESGIYPALPIVDPEQYKAIVKYVLERAPDSLERLPESPLLPLQHGRPHFISYPAARLPSFTYLKIKKGKIEAGDLRGNLATYDPALDAWDETQQFESPVVETVHGDSLRWVLTVGILNPSEQARGKLYEIGGDGQRLLADSLHRPVHFVVTRKDGEEKFTIAEFGHLTGRLSAVYREEGGYGPGTVIATPGAIRVLEADIDGDENAEQLVLFAQGDERLVAIRDNTGDEVQVETLMRFSPLSGVSWFELADVDGDGDPDIITAHGDNADKTYVQKPYHGIRIHTNDGEGNFIQAYAYPLHGATRVVATDWDGDGDPDLAVVAAFPDYAMDTPRSFILLENRMNEALAWRERSIPAINQARWFLMDAADLDGDGDQDIVLGVFNYHITPVPEKYLQKWNKEAVGLLILENILADEAK